MCMMMDYTNAGGVTFRVLV